MCELHISVINELSTKQIFLFLKADINVLTQRVFLRVRVSGTNVFLFFVRCGFKNNTNHLNLFDYFPSFYSGQSI